MHTIFYSRDAGALRGLFRDVLKLRSVDAGHGWLIFAAPPSELAVHPTEGDSYVEVFLMTTNLDRTIRDLRKSGLELSESITEQRWGRVARLKLPGGQSMGLYEPRHPIAIRMGATKGDGTKEKTAHKKKAAWRKVSRARHKS